MSDMEDQELEPELTGEELAETATPAATEAPERPGLELPNDVLNLVPYLLDEAAKEGGERIKRFLERDLPDQVLEDLREGLEGREEWMENRRETLKLWLGALEEKTEPWKNCANLHIPLMFSRCTRLAARAFAEIFKQGQPILTAQANSRLSEERAEAVTMHMNWNLRKKVPAFPRHVQRALQEFFLNGDCVFHSFRDLDRNVNRHDYCSPENFVYPYVLETVEPDMSDVPWKIKILHPRKRELLRMAKKGYYSKEQVDKVVKEKGTYEDDIDHPVRDEANRAEGVDRTDSTRDAPYTTLEYHGWVQFPYQDEEVPVRVVLAKASKVVMGLYLRYYDDPDDRARFDQQTAEHQQYMASVQMFQQAMQQENDLLLSLQQPGVPSEEGLAVARQVQAQRPNPPVAPGWMKPDGSPPERCRQKVIEPFSHAVCIENPDGSYGLGVGVMLKPHNMAANIMLNQTVDQGTLSLGGITFMHSAAKLPPGVTTLEPNKINYVDGIPPDALAKSIFQLPLPQPNSVLMTGVQMQEAAADAVSSAPDVLSGQKDGDETFRGQATRVEQATKQLTVLAGNFMLALTQIARNEALLNFQFLPERSEIDVSHPMTNKMQQVTIGRDMYRDDLDIVFTADLTFASRAAKVGEKDDVLGLLTKGVPPQLATLVLNPDIFAAAIRDCLVVRGSHDLAALLPTGEQIQQRMMAAQQAQMAGAPGAAPGGPPGPGGPAPAPSIPTGQETRPPGSAPPQTHIPQDVPQAAAPSGVQ